jgi:hypothetical protein
MRSKVEGAAAGAVLVVDPSPTPQRSPSPVTGEEPDCKVGVTE